MKATLTSITTGSTFLITVGGQPLDSLCGEIRGSYVLGDDDPWQDQMAGLSKRLEKLPRSAGIVVAWLGIPGGWQESPEKRKAVLQRIASGVSKQGLTSVWFLAEELFPPSVWGDLKADSDLYMHFWPLGQHLVAHVLTDTGSTHPAGFLPRRVRIEDAGIRLDAPSVPVMEADESPADGGPRTVVNWLDEPYRRLFQANSEAMLLFGFDGRAAQPNERARALLGYTDEELGSIRLQDIFPPGALFSACRNILRARKTGRGSWESLLARRNRKGIPVALTMFSVGDGWFCVTARDRSETVRLQEDIASADDRYRMAISEAPYALLVVQNRRKVEHNATFGKMFPWVGPRLEESTGLHELFGEKSTQGVRDLFALIGAAEKEQVPRRAELRFVSADGVWVDAEVHALPGTWSGKRAIRLTFLDITERKAFFRTLQESEGKYRTLVENSATAIAVLRDGVFIFINKGFLELFGYLLPEDLLGREIVACVHSRERKGVLERLKGSARGPVRFDFTGVRKDNSRVNIQLFGEPIQYEGHPSFVCYCVDISSMVKTASDVERKRRDADTLEHLLSAFHSTLDLDSVVRNGLQTSIRRLAYESGLVLLSDPKQGTLVSVVSEDVPQKVVEVLQGQPIDQGLTGYVAKTLDPVLLTVRQYPPFLPFKSLFEQEGVQSIAGVPLVSGEVLHGLLFLFSQKEIEASDQETQFLGVVGRHFGDSLKNALEFQRLTLIAEQHLSALENAPQIIYECAPTGSFRYLHPAVERLLGHGAQEFIASPDLWRTLVHPDERAVYSMRVSRQGGEELEFAIEYRMLPKGKASYRLVRDVVRYRKDASGKVTAIHGTITDITEAKAATTQTQESEAVLRDVLDTMGDALVLTDLNGVVREVNMAFTRLTGYTRHSVIGVGMPYPWLPEEDMRASVHWLEELRQKHSIQDFDMTWRRQDGTDSAISLTTTLLRDAKGQPRAILNLARDISERKRRSGELLALYELGRELTGAQNEDVLFRVVGNAFEKALASEHYGFDRYRANSASLQPGFVGPQSGEHVTVGSPWQTKLAPDHPLWTCVSDALSYRGRLDDNRSFVSVPVISKRKLEGVLWAFRVDPESYTEGDLRLVESIATLMAIALDRVRLYDETVANAREIHSRNEELDHFAYVVSHDLKEPLVTIDGYARIVMGEAATSLSAQAQEHLQSIMRSTERMKHLIDDLLTLSRVGRPSGTASLLPMRELLTDLLRDIEFMLLERNAVVSIPEALPSVHYDPTELGMILRNLIINGIKFNTSESPRISIAVEEGPAEYAVSVADNGIGISEEDHEKIFSIFQRLHPTGHFSGTGAGLTIVKKIVESRGGRIWLTSRPEAGSTFTFTIPRHD